MTNERVDELIQNASVDEIKKVIKDENLNMNISQILVLIEATGDIDFIRECMKNEELGVPHGKVRGAANHQSRRL